MIRPFLLATTLFASPALAEDCISTELALLADVSSSMTDKEKAIQRDGYAAAFRHPDVLDAILGTYCGSIAVSYIEFGNHAHEIVGWSVIANVEDAEHFAQAIETGDRTAVNDQNSNTGLANGMRFAARSILNNGITAERMVVDVSADGGNNYPRVDCIRGEWLQNPTKDVRDEFSIGSAENGWREITFNALPIVGGKVSGTCGMSLSSYMQEFVMGGPGAFLIEANGVSDLPKIVRQKIAREIG